MEAQEFEVMARVERDMWWYTGLHARLLAGLNAFCGPDRCRVVDIGCGTGGFLSRLTGQPRFNAIGLEYYFPACVHAHDRRGLTVVNGSIHQIPFPSDSLDAIVLSDVLCQDTVDANVALRECLRCLRPGGTLIVNVPAYAWLKSRHDELVHAAKRFTLGGLAKPIRANGFDIVYRTYWNTLLFPLMLLRRKVFSGAESTSDVFEYPAVINALFKGILKIEAGLLALGLRMPFGGSALIVASKPATQ